MLLVGDYIESIEVNLLNLRWNKEANEGGDDWLASGSIWVVAENGVQKHYRLSSQGRRSQVLVCA
jgi:hypothetical protein